MTFLSKAGAGRTIVYVPKKQVLFEYGKRGNAVFYILTRTVKLTVVSQGKEATIGLLGPGSFTGRECIAIGKRLKRSRGSTAIAPHEFRFAQDMTLHGTFEVWFGGSGLQVELCSERIQLEIIAVWCARRGTWTPIADLAKVVASLQRSGGKLFLFFHSFWQFFRVCREVV